MEWTRNYEEFKEWLENMYESNEIRLSKKVKPIVFGEILRRYEDILYARSKASTDNEWSAEADARCREMSAYLLALSDVGKITKYVYNVIYGTIYSSYHC